MADKLELLKISQLVNQKHFNEALNLLTNLVDNKPYKEQACKLIVKASLEINNYKQAKRALKELLILSPNNFNYLSIYSDICLLDNEFNSICSAYRNFIESNPNHAVAHFNYAYYLSKAGEFERAINFYCKALSLNINDKQEVYLNIANIYADYLRDDKQAEKMLHNALSCKPTYVDAMYNLANLYEQQGKIEKAFSLFKKAYQQAPDRVNILARLLELRKIDMPDDHLITEAQQVIKSQTINENYLCDLYYSLGKAFNDCKDYKKAFFYYEKANSLNRKFITTYNPKNFTCFIDSIIGKTQNDLQTSLGKINQFSPVFICGMYRSGSTLLEQILAAHDKVTAGGEIEFFQRYIAYNMKEFPYNLTDFKIKPEKRIEIAKAYQNEIQQAFGAVNIVTDKRLDNLFYLGIIKQIFPKAKIIFTQRDMLDNCLSIFFLRLGSQMNYATNLNEIIHYYQEQQRLVKHWQKIYAQDTYIFNYDSFIINPKQEIKNVLHFLALPWQDSCLNFHQVNNTVKTASVWQVRQPIYTTSSGRWKNYAQQLREIGVIN